MPRPVSKIQTPDFEDTHSKRESITEFEQRKHSIITAQATQRHHIMKSEASPINARSEQRKTRK
jgi:hypothetical protein